MKVLTHPHRRSRRERALAQRRHELADWQNPNSERVQELKPGPEGTVDEIVASKISRAQADIAALAAKGID